MTARTAAVLAGGLGTRLAPALPGVPKALAPVAGEPFLAKLLRWAAAGGTERAVLLCGHLAPALEGFARGWNAAGRGPVVDISVEPAPLGTGGAVRFALERLPEEFFLLNGDTLCPVPLGSMAEAHRRGGAAATLAAVHEAEGASRGALEMDQEDRVLGFAEKGRRGPGWINAGVYRLRRSLFEGLPAGAAASLETDLLPAWIARGERVRAFRTDAPFLDIGTPADWDRAQTEGWLP
ncbi:MAG: NTP transferase domain-containing protein [Candidatus Eisenbacteria bacterium]|nr:NTP transferase domain-containing protein [Candidatus Eisenbacteria bacterium]